MNEQFVNELATALRKVGTIHRVGEEWISPTGEIPVGGVPYNGQMVVRSTYSALWAYAQAKGLVKTEAEWQTLSSSGDVPYFSTGDGSTTFRMPKISGKMHGVYAFGAITETGELDTPTLVTAVAQVEANQANYLPLSGGTMTGDIVFGTDAMVIRKPTRDKYLAFRGGDGYSTGASLVLYGKDSADTPGAARFIAHNGTDNYSLYCYPNGTMTWAGKNVVTESSSLGASGYMLFSNGFMICWGSGTCNKNVATTFTFAKAFTQVYGATTGTVYTSTETWNGDIHTLTNTTIKLMSASVDRTMYYFAYGKV